MKKGFTLIELLAVIVILAIILVIAIPQILGVLEGTKEKTLESNINMIIKAVKQEIAEKTIANENITLDGKCEDVSTWDPINGNCVYEINPLNNEVFVTINGTKKFKGISASGSKENVEIVHYNNDEEQTLVIDGKKIAEITNFELSNRYISGSSGFTTGYTLIEAIDIFGDYHKIETFRTRPHGTVETLISSDSNIFGVINAQSEETGYFILNFNHYSGADGRYEGTFTALDKEWNGNDKNAVGIYDWGLYINGSFQRETTDWTFEYTFIEN